LSHSQLSLCTEQTGSAGLQPVESAASAHRLWLLRVYDCGVFTAASLVALMTLILHGTNGIGWLPTSSIGSLGSPPLARVRWRVLRHHLYCRARGSHFAQQCIESAGLPDRQPHVRWRVWRHHRYCHVRGFHLSQRASNPLASGQFGQQPRLNNFRWCALAWLSLPLLLSRS